MFDPWTATEEEAVVAQLAQENGLVPTAPIHQWYAVQRLRKVEAAGSLATGFDILECVQRCITRGLVAPEWLALAFNKRYTAVLDCHAASWDDELSFGRPYPKGTHINSLRKVRKFKFAVWLAVRDKLRATPNRPIDNGLFEEVGEALGLGKTAAQVQYAQAASYLGRVEGKRGQRQRSKFSSAESKLAKKA